MRRIVLNVALLSAVALVIGCDNKGKATMPSKLDQSLPTVAPVAGGGGDVPAKKAGKEAAKKNAQPNAKVD